eukprot:6202670-Pleurochrysis_carterae.AAC.2
MDKGQGRGREEGGQKGSGGERRKRSKKQRVERNDWRKQRAKRIEGSTGQEELERAENRRIGAAGRRTEESRG